MTDRRTVAAVGILAFALVATAVALPSIAAGVPANRVPVTDMSGEGANLASPTADAWEKVESTEVPLASAPSGLPNAGSVSTDVVTVETARTESELYVRMHWRDDTKNASSDAPTEFADGAAIQVPVNATAQPDIALGSQGTPVNVWYWSADTGAEEILAGGQGTITTMDDTVVETKAVHQDGTWTVVMHRSLTADGENRASLAVDSDVDVAFAVWNGANAERSGHHAVSEWFTFPFGPGDTGPAFQYLLWALAGIAIAVALVITVRAVRGSR
ncbi:MAG: ethylbenzene dehydrogenase-related protein [Halanaeroarchaeum sp.]